MLYVFIFIYMRVHMCIYTFCYILIYIFVYFIYYLYIIYKCIHNGFMATHTLGHSQVKCSMLDKS